ANLGPATVMIQREVAERLLAGPGSKTYGSLSVLFQLHADLERVLEVGPDAFWPAPKVHSTVLRLTWLAAPRAPVGDEPGFERVVRAAFGLRRKTLRNALSAAFPRPVVELGAVQAGVPLDARAESLSLEVLARLSHEVLAAESAWLQCQKSDR